MTETSPKMPGHKGAEKWEAEGAAATDWAECPYAPWSMARRHWLVGLSRARRTRALESLPSEEEVGG